MTNELAAITSAADRIYVRGLRADAALARFRARKHREAGRELQADIQDDLAIEADLVAARFIKSRVPA